METGSRSGDIKAAMTSARPGHVDNAIADQGDATVDHSTTRDLGKAAGGACERLAAIGDGAAHDGRAAGQRFDDCACAERAAVQRQCALARLRSVRRPQWSRS
jgi:hypothetical protein